MSSEIPDYKKVNTKDLIPYARNSRTHSDEQVNQIVSSIKEFGFLNPIIVDGENGIIAGHGRVMAAQKLGLEVLPVIEAAHLTETQKRAYVIADNKLALNAGWDDELLRIEFDELSDDGFDLELTGFSLDEIDALQIDEIQDGLTDEDAVPEAPDEPVSKRGDIWILGNHRLMCGDSTSIDDVERLMGGRKADFVLTDPPYNQETNGGFKGEIGASLKKQSSDISHLCNFDPETVLPIIPMAQKKGVINSTIFCNKDLVPKYLNWAVDNKYSFNILVWKKPSAIPLGGSYQPDIEYCLVFRRSAKFNTKQKGVSYSKVLEHNRETGLHPTMKPVGMLENQVKIVSDSGDTCLDLFGGSGSTLIACEKTNRQARLMELDEKYVDVIIKRWEEYTGKKAVHIETGKTYGELQDERL